MRNRVLLAALATVIALVLSGCNAILEGFGDTDAQSCECDTLAVTVVSTDWAGDGREPGEIRRSVGFAATGQYPLVVSITYGGVTTVAGRDGLFEHVVSTMAENGFAPADERGSPERDRKVEYVGDSWTLSVSTSGSQERFFVLVTADEPDEKAPEYLEPLIDAFGTR